MEEEAQKIITTGEVVDALLEGKEDV